MRQNCANLGEPILLVLPAVPVIKHGNRFVVETKALEGWRAYASLWPGRTRYVFREGDKEALIFAQSYAANELPGELTMLSRDADLSDVSMDDAAVVLASGDAFDQLQLAAQAKRLGIPLVYIIEYTLKTRIRIAVVEGKTLVGKLKSILWLILQERRRREAFSLAVALQANGLPAARAFRGAADKILLYFDTRLRAAMAATDPELASKAVYQLRHAPLRLAFTGRLERLKGADHLIPVARELIKRDVAFRLDIFGTGTLRDEIGATLAANDILRRHVFLHDPIDFASALVPWLRASADVFICPHVQGDPSCTYSETLGCGVPILGYANEAWTELLSFAGNVGWSVQLGKPTAMADKVAHLSLDRNRIIEAARAARDFGRSHSFEGEFGRRIDHLRSLAKSLMVSENGQNGSNRA